MKNKENVKIHEILLIITYMLMIVLLAWFTANSNNDGDKSGVIYSVILFVIVFFMYVYTYFSFKQTNKMTDSMRNTTKKILEDFEESEEYLWEKYKNLDNLFEDESLNNRYIRYCKEQSRLEKIGKKKGSLTHFEDYINYELIDEKIHKNLLSIFPGTMTGLGILFTFVGLSLCLQSFRTGTAEEILSGIDPLIGGLKVAFHTSIYGLIFSIVYNFSYRKELEDCYNAVDDLVDIFTEYVNPENENDIFNSLMEYQENQWNGVNTIVSHVEAGITDALEATITPQFDRLNKTIFEFATGASQVQTEGIKKMVDSFMSQMNRSVGNHFKEVRDAMVETCSIQKEYVESMRIASGEITNSVKRMTNVSKNLDKTANSLDVYVSKIQLLQEKVQEGFDHYAIQIQENNQIVQTQKEYMQEILSTQKSINDTLSKFISDTESCLTKLHSQSGIFVETAEKTMMNVIKNSEEWNKKFEESLNETQNRLIKAEKEIEESVQNNLNYISQSAETFSQLISNSTNNNLELITKSAENFEKSLSEAANNSVNAIVQNAEVFERTITNNTINNISTISNNAQKYGETIADQAKNQLLEINDLKEQIRGEIVQSAIRLEKSAASLEISMSTSMTEAFKEYDEELKTTMKELNNTIRSVRNSTGVVPRVISDGHRELESAIEQTENKMQDLLNSLDLIYKKTRERQESLEETELKFKALGTELENTISLCNEKKKQIEEIVTSAEEIKETFSNSIPSFEENEEQEKEVIEEPISNTESEEKNIDLLGNTFFDINAL